jgi:hypothetical protein
VEYEKKRDCRQVLPISGVHFAEEILSFAIPASLGYMMQVNSSLNSFHELFGASPDVREVNRG